MLRSLLFILAILLTLDHASAQDSKPLIERQTFIPVEDLDVVIARDQAGVLLSKAEFQKLYDAAKKNAEAQPKLPATVATTGADYAAKIDGDHLVIAATIRFQQFASGWVELPLDFGNLSVLSATVNDQPAKLVRRVPAPTNPVPQQAQAAKIAAPAPTQLVLFHNQVGAATLKLELSTILESVGGDKSARFELATAPTAVLQVDVAANRTMKWFGRSLDRPTPADQPATYRLPVGGHRNMLLLFTGNLTQQSTDSLTFASTGYGVRVAPGEVVWEAQTHLQVFGTPLTTLQCVVPRTLEITDVASTGLEAWSLADSKEDPQATVITLSYRQPIDSGRDITFKGVMSTPVGQGWAVPQIVIRKVTSHIGRCVVTHPAGVRLRLIEATGARAAASDQAATLTFDLWRESFRLVLETQPHQREVMATTATTVDLNARGVDLIVTASLETLFAPLFEVDVRLPADWNVQSIVLDGQPTQWLSAAKEAGWNDLRINLPKSVQPGSGIGLTIQARREMESWPVESEPIEFKLPSFQLPQAATVEGTLVLKADEDLDVDLDSLTGLDPTASSSPGARSAFAYQDTAFEGQVKVERRASRMSAQTISYSRLDREVWHTHLEALIDITGGGLREVKVKLPEEVGNDIRFVVLEGTVGIAEQVAEDPADKARVWTLRLDRRFRGALRLGADVSQARKDEKKYSVPALVLPQAERVNGFLGIEGAADQQLTIDANDGQKRTLGEVDPIDLPLCHYVPQQRIVAAYRFMQPGYVVTLEEQRFDRLAVPTAICQSAKYESVVSRTGELQHRADYVFVAVTAQALKLTLPVSESGEPELWAVLIDGQPTEVRRITEEANSTAKQSSYLIPLPRDKAVDAQRRLSLFYRGQIGHLQNSQRWREAPPVLSVVQSEGAEQPLEILSQNWVVHYSNDLLITGSDGLFEPQGELDSQSLLGDLRQSFTGMSPMSLFHSASYIFGTVMLAVVITALLRKHGVSKLGCGAVIVAIPVILVSLLLPTVQSARSYKTASYMSDDAAPAPSAAPMNPTSQRYRADGFIPTDETTTLHLDPTDAAAKWPALGLNEPPAANEAAEMPFEAKGGSDRGGFDIREVGAPEGSNQNTPGGTGFGGRRRPKPTPQVEPKLADAPIAIDPLADAKKDGAKAEELKPAQQEAVQAMDAEGALAKQIPPADQRRLEVREETTKRRPARDKSGLLSLSLNLEVPANSVSKEFFYYGHQPVSSGIGLDLNWQDRKGGDAWRWFLVTGLAMAAWLALKLAPRWRGLLAVLGITLPLGLVAVTPPTWHVVLDGLFVGSLLASVLWGLRALIAYESAICRRLCGTRSATTTAALLLVALGTSSAMAQEAKPGPQPAVAPMTTGTTDVDRKTIIIPVEDAKDPTKSERVLLSRELFFDLWNLANPDQRVVAPASVPSLIASARYDVQLRPKTAQLAAAALVKATLVLQNFRDEQAIVSLPLNDIAITAAKLNGQAAPLQVRDIEGRKLLDVVLDKSGAHQLEIEFAITAQVEGSVGQFTLPQFPAPSGTVVFQLPQKTLQVRVNGSTSAYRRLEQNDAAFVAIPVGNNQRLNVAWNPPQQQAAVSAIVNVDSTTGVLVDASGIRHSTRLLINVPQGTLADASFELPKNTLLQRISGPNLAGWELAPDAAAKRVRVFFNPPINSATELQFQLFQEQLVGDDATNLTLSAVRPLDVTRESGVIGVLATDDFSIRSQQEAGMRRVELNAPGQFGDLISTQPTASVRMGFAFSTRPATAQVQVARQAAESVATTAHAVKVTRRKVQIASKFDLEFRRAARPSITFKLPESYRPSDVQATSMADWFLTPGEGANPRTLTIEFTQPLTGKAQVVMQGYQVKGPDDAIAEVLVPQPLEMATQSTSTAIWFDAGYVATLTQFDGWKAVAANQLPPQLLHKQPTPPQFALTSTSLDVPPLGFDLLLSQPRLTADSVVITTVTDTTVEYSLALKWKVANAAADSFWFTTPLWLKDRLTVKGAGLRDVKSAEVDGVIRWTVTLWDAVPSEYFALAVATLPPAAKRIDTPEVQFLQPALTPDGTPGALGPLATQRHFAMLVNQSQMQLKPSHGEDIETVPAEDIPIVVNKELQQQAAEILRIRHGSKLPAWDIRRLEQQAGAPASVNLADLSLVLSADGTWRGQAEYSIRNRRRQFLAVRMPEKSRLLSVFVSDAPSRAVRTKIKGLPKDGAEAPEIDVQLIPLPKSNASDLSFKVKLVYAGELASSLPRGVFPLSVDVDLPAADVITQQESPEYGIPVAKTVWHVFVPKGIDAMLIDDGVRTNVTPTDREEVDAYIASNWIRDGEQLMSQFTVMSRMSESERRSQVRNNLKQQGLALNNLYQIEQKIAAASSSGANNPEFESSRRQFAEKLAQNKDNFAIVQQEQANSYYVPRFGSVINNGQQGAWAGQQGQQGQQGRSVVDENNDAVLNYNSVGNLRQLGLANSEDINRNGVLDPGEDLNGNGALDFIVGATGDASGRQDDLGLSFQLEVRDGDISKPMGSTNKSSGDAKGKKVAEQAPATKAQTSNRSVQREQSLSRLKSLNDSVEMQQQVQQFDVNAFQNQNGLALPNATNPTAPGSGPIGNGINGPGAGFQNGIALPGQAGPGSNAGGAMLPNSSNPQFGRGLNYGNNAILGQQGGFGGGIAGGGFGGGLPGKQQVPGQPQANGAPANAPAPELQLDAAERRRMEEEAMTRPLVAAVDGRSNSNVAPQQAWSAVGGLSLPIELPGKEQELIFSKVSGAPKLALKLRSREVVQTGFGLLWLAVWLGVGATFAVLFLRSSWKNDIGKPVAWLLIAVGLIVYVVLPQPLRSVGFLTFVAGLIMLGVRYVRART